MAELKSRGGNPTPDDNGFNALDADDTKRMEDFVAKKAKGEPVPEGEEEYLMQKIMSTLSTEELLRVERQADLMAEIVRIYDTGNREALMVALSSIEDVDDLMALLVTGVAAMSILNRGKNNNN